MPRPRLKSLSPASRERLVDELSAIWKAVLDNPGLARDCDTGLIIMRLCAGLTMEQWSELAAKHDLSRWMALPLRENPAPHLVELQKILEDLTYRSEHDSLTNLANRAQFERFLELEFERAGRTGAPLSLAMFDVDDFKAVNDAHGHPCGDKVLVEMAGILLAGKRGYDLAARIGGEEFVLVLPGAGMIRALAVVERLLEVLGERVFSCSPSGAGPFRVTASAGLACHRGGAGLSPAQLIEMADKALYKAKENGKNRVEKAPLPPLPEDIRKTYVHSEEKRFLFTGGK
ncbi:MAG: GGDEF domain-containing protein [Desulfovibrionaceae bacterium]|nr:GGDEF domain-containing protein [Desulfovibrionaceae bacterium]MBF0514791.1 GGDEF domain-containing protein [Desulfovibrionaceae bacterium]